MLSEVTRLSKDLAHDRIGFLFYLARAIAGQPDLEITFPDTMTEQQGTKLMDMIKSNDIGVSLFLSDNKISLHHQHRRIKTLQQLLDIISENHTHI